MSAYKNYDIYKILVLDIHVLQALILTGQDDLIVVVQIYMIEKVFKK